MRGDRADAFHGLAYGCFNPRPCMRGDIYPKGSKAGFSQFQSTPLHEGRQQVWILWHRLGAFQSTPLHEGRL